MAVNDILLTPPDGFVGHVSACRKVERRDGVVIENNVLG